LGAFVDQKPIIATNKYKNIPDNISAGIYWTEGHNVADILLLFPALPLVV